MGKFDFLKDVLAYIKDKAQSFLQKNGLENDFESICKSTMSPTKSFSDNVSSLLNEVISRVADATGKNLNDVYDDFCKHYLHN